METGATIAFGSDYPFGSLDPIAGLHTAVNHFHPCASLPSSSSSPSLCHTSHSVAVHNDHNFDLKNKKQEMETKEKEDKEQQKKGGEKEREEELMEGESCRGYAVFRPDQKISLRESLHFYTKYIFFLFNYYDLFSFLLLLTEML